jgi:ABC-type glycerol-3-phosphate transport system substrate-binding protein
MLGVTGSGRGGGDVEGEKSGAGRGGLTRRGVIGSAAATAGALTLAACGQSTGGPAAAPASSELAGNFDLLYQTWAVGDIYHQQAVEAFARKYPKVKVSLVPVAYGDLAPKVRTSVAAGSGPDGFQTYTGFWRGTDAATIMLPLTPSLFKRAELEQITFPNLLNAVWSKKNETYVLPHSVGMNGSMLVYNARLLSDANVDPKGLTSLDGIVAAAAKLTTRAGGEVTRAGVLPTSQTNLIMRWIIDQGGKFYDEKTYKWTWQTPEAERAFQWILDLYDKHSVAWRKQPDGIKDAVGEARAASIIHGAYALSNYVKNYPDVQLVDQPMPAFSAGKTPNFYEHEIAGYALSALLKPDDAKARIGATFFKDLLSPDGARALANEYSGAILAKSVYADPGFKDTKFGPVRAKLPDQIISRMLLMTMAADPGAFGMHVTRVVNGELSVKAALQDMQQTYTAKEDEARRNMG